MEKLALALESHLQPQRDSDAGLRTESPTGTPSRPQGKHPAASDTDLKKAYWTTPGGQQRPIASQSIRTNQASAVPFGSVRRLGPKG